MSSFVSGQLSVSEGEGNNNTIYRNGSTLDLLCNVTLLSPGNANLTFNVSLYTNLNGTWVETAKNVTNITEGAAGNEIEFLVQSNQSNGTFNWDCFGINNATSNPLSGWGENRTLWLYYNYSISLDDFLNGATLPFSNNIFVEFIVNGLDPNNYFFEGPNTKPFYNCTLLTNITANGAGTGLQDNGYGSPSIGFNGSQAGFFPGEVHGRIPPFIIPQINLGTGANASAVVGYQISCLDPYDVPILSPEGTFSLDLAAANFFNPDNFNFTIGGELFEFSTGPPFFFGNDNNDAGVYTEGLNILGIAEKDGPFIISILDIAGNKFDFSGPCAGQDPFSCTNYTGVRNTPRCSANSSALLRNYYSFYIDLDGNESTGCNVTSPETGTNYSGFDVQLFANYSSTTGGALVRLCNVSIDDHNDGIDFDKADNYNTSLITASIDNQFGCDVGTVAIKWNIDQAEQALGVSLDNGPDTERWYAKSGNVSRGFTDGLSDIAIYTEGTIDFVPFDPNKCFAGNEFGVDNGAYAASDEHGNKCSQFTNGKGFFDHTFFGENCFNGVDDDNDGNIDTQDSDCSFRPGFSGSDKKAPSVIFTKVEKFDISAVVVWNTNEPTKGTVLFYGTNKTGSAAFNPNAGSCGQVNKTLVDDPVPGQSFDDFKPFHDVPLDEVASDSLGFNLTNSTTYYYRTNSTDRSNNTAISNCLSFKTKAFGTASLNDNHEVFFPFGDFGNFFGAEFKLDSGNGFGNFDPTSAVNVGGGKDFNLRFAPPAGDFGFVFGGMDLTGNVTVNFTNAIKVNTSADDPFLGIDHTTWLEMVQDLKLDYVDLTIPDTGDTLFKCAEDGVTNCTSVSDLAEIVGSTSTSTTWRVGTDIGFSTLSMANSSFEVASDQNEYECYPTCSFIINYTNNNSVFESGYYTVSVLNESGNSAITIVNITASNLTNGSTWVVVGGTNAASVANISLNTTSNPLQFNVTVSMSSYTSSKLNLTIVVNGTRRPSFRPFIGSINVTGPLDGYLHNATNLSLDFKTNVFSAYDTNQTCSFNINASQGINASAFRGINATESIIALNVQVIGDGVYSWNTSCLNAGNETAVSGENRIITLNSPPLVDAISQSSSGTATVTNTITVTTDENATCKYGTSDAEFNATSLTAMTANASGTGHSAAPSYTSSTSGNYYIRCNDTNNNYMSFSNSSAFSITVTSSTSSSTSSGGSGGGGGTAVNTNIKASASKLWNTLAPGGNAILIVDNAKISVTQVKVGITGSVINGELKVSSLGKNPRSKKPDGEIYQYLEITKTKMDEDKTGQITISFKVPKSWLSDNSIAEGDISLFRYDSEEWGKLSTKKTKSDSEFAYYESTTPGLSAFAVVATTGGSSSESAQSDSTETSQPTQSDETPPDKEKDPALTDNSAEFKTKLSEPASGKSKNKKILPLLIFIIVALGLFTVYFIWRSKNRYRLA
jgi:PGF-pre-PGF domain-containing protein